ncbi:MFS transporter [Zavarzinia compransoris]|uniref:MFS transporter n=1 Tax=Zavarzinia compransoris TaxID=1264899 RepID=A0A317E9D5_9PROT|nr:MFS transporter [Zavarzinia compransoris]PWR23192.1 MFS transporter [Zavarzinia compransoris]TDP46250.1 putative MFS family arabinose efflux permease [Zavarzinia compransoris]
MAKAAGGRNGALMAVVAAAAIMSVALGTRQTFGLFLGPLSAHHGLAVTWVAFAIALHNLSWGLAQPVAGAAADRFGAAPVVLAGALAFAAGLALTAVVPNGPALILGMGVLVGLGISCTSFGVVMTAVGKAAAPERRSQAMGLAGAGGSLGQVALVPVAQGLVDGWGPAVALLGLGAVILLAAPLGGWLDRRGAETAPAPAPVPLRAALRQAAKHRGYRLLTLGFFTCGFQLAFIATHLPGYLTLCQMPVGLGAVALALIGLFNMGGTWACGWLGGRYRQGQVLGWLYLLRGGVIAAFFLLPKTEVAVLAFAAAMGLLWLGTVPLTSGLIARMFGVGNLGALFGVCFLSHQVGSFLGAWAGGLAFDLSGSYGPVWAATALAGLVAALLHFAIDDRPAATPPLVPALS